MVKKQQYNYYLVNISSTDSIQEYNALIKVPANLTETQVEIACRQVAFEKVEWGYDQVNPEDLPKYKNNEDIDDLTGET